MSLELPDELKALATGRWQQLSESNNFSESWQVHRDTIEKVFALSDFVSEHCLRDAWFLTELLDNELLLASSLDFQHLLGQQLNEVSDEEQLLRQLRRFRNLHMLRIAWRDLLNLQDIEESLLQVSVLADQLITQAYSWLYKNLAIRFGEPVGMHGQLPMFIIGMGKLGGGELNFSSDIDLIFTYPENGETKGGKKSIEHQQFFTKLAQKLISALHQHTVDEGLKSAFELIW